MEKHTSSVVLKSILETIFCFLGLVSEVKVKRLGLGPQWEERDLRPLFFFFSNRFFIC